MMSDDDDNQVKHMTMKVKVGSNHSNLFEDLIQHGLYFRSRRLLHLALLGLAFEKSGARIQPSPSSEPVEPVQVAETRRPQKKRAKDTPSEPPVSKDVAATEAPHYVIPEGAADALGAMFDTMGT